MNSAQKSIEDFINDQLKHDLNIFHVNTTVSSGNDIKVFLDGDNGVTIDKCVQLNRSLYKFIEENGLFPNNDFSLEVSSPGVDEPLKLIRQYKKNIGRTVEVTMLNETKKQGKLLSVTGDEIVIEEKKGKEKRAHPNNKEENVNSNNTVNILFNQIKHTIVLVTF